MSVGSIATLAVHEVICNSEMQKIVQQSKKCYVVVACESCWKLVLYLLETTTYSMSFSETYHELNTLAQAQAQT